MQSNLVSIMFHTEVFSLVVKIAERVGMACALYIFEHGFPITLQSCKDFRAIPTECALALGWQSGILD